MAEKEEIGLVKLRDVRLSFEHIWKKSASVKNGPLKYRASFLIDPKTPQGKKNISAMEDAIDQVIVQTWPKKEPRFKADRYPLRKGNDCVDANGDVRDGYEGMMYVPATNDRKPKVRDRDPEVELTEEDDKIYSGAYVIAYLRLYPIKDQDKGGAGIFASLEGVQFMRHGEKFAGGGIDDDEFENLGDEDDGEDAQPSRRRTIDDDDRPTSRRRASDDDDRPQRRREEDRSARRRVLVDDDI